MLDDGTEGEGVVVTLLSDVKLTPERIGRRGECVRVSSGLAGQLVSASQAVPGDYKPSGGFTAYESKATRGATTTD